MRAGSMRLSSSTVRIAVAPSSVAESGASAPRKLPTGVRRAARMTISEAMREQFPSDQHAADLVRAATDIIDLGVAQQAARRRVVHIAARAEALDGLGGSPVGGFGGE